MLHKTFSVFALAASVCASGFAVNAEFDVFKIRNHSGSISAPWDSDLSVVENAAGDGFSAATPRSGQKVGYGTSILNGLQVNKLQSVDFEVVAGALNKLPYINLWVKNAVSGFYGILAIDPDFRNVDFLSGGQNWYLYEYDTTAPVSIDWLFDGGSNALGGGNGHEIIHNGGQINLGDLSNDLIFTDPGDPYPTYVGSGAPRGGHGLNLIFGDTEANYVGAMAIEKLSFVYDGTEYTAGNSSVPDAGSSVAMLLLGLGSLVAYRSRKK